VGKLRLIGKGPAQEGKKISVGRADVSCPIMLSGEKSRAGRKTRASLLAPPKKQRNRLNHCGRARKRPRKKVVLLRGTRKLQSRKAEGKKGPGAEKRKIIGPKPGEGEVVIHMREEKNVNTCIFPKKSPGQCAEGEERKSRFRNGGEGEVSFGSHKRKKAEKKRGNGLS